MILEQIWLFAVCFFVGWMLRDRVATVTQPLIVGWWLGTICTVLMIAWIFAWVMSMREERQSTQNWEV